MPHPQRFIALNTERQDHFMGMASPSTQVNCIKEWDQIFQNNEGQDGDFVLPKRNFGRRLTIVQSFVTDVMHEFQILASISEEGGLQLPNPTAI